MTHSEFYMNYNERNAFIKRGLANLKKSDQDKEDQEIAKNTQAIELNPNDAWLYCSRGIRYIIKGSSRKEHSFIDLGIEDLDHALELNQDFAEAYRTRGGAYFFKGENDKAIEDYNHAIQLNSDDFEAYYRRGCTYKRKEDYARAIKDFETALRINPNNQDVRTAIEEAQMLQKMQQ